MIPAHKPPRTPSRHRPALVAILSALAGGACGGQLSAEPAGDAGTTDAAIADATAVVDALAPDHAAAPDSSLGDATWDAAPGDAAIDARADVVPDASPNPDALPVADASPGTDASDGGADACTGVTQGIVTLAAQQALSAIAVSADGVFWSTSQAIMKASLDGCTVSTFGEGTATGITVAGGNVYWVDRLTGTLRTAPAAGGATTTVADPIPSPTDITSFGASIFWTAEFDAGGIWTLSEGGAPVPLAPGPWAIGIATDGVNVYWGDLGSGTVSSVPVGGGGGGEVRTIATGQLPESVATDGVNVYWVNYVAPEGVGNGSVMQEGVSGGGTPLTIAANQPLPISIATDGAFVYWANHNGGVMRAPVGGGGPPTTLASSTKWNPESVAIDATSIYWTTNQGSVMKLTPR